jgi:hypothetical protein
MRTLTLVSSHLISTFTFIFTSIFMF